MNVMTTINILAIESSCDDTSAAVIQNGKVLSNCVANQEIHTQYGGVVPEVASRAHQENIVPIVDVALKQAGIEKEDIHAVAFTRGPGLIGSLIVGISFAKAYALSLGIPLIEVNHLQAHVLAHFAREPYPAFPFLCLTVSGGHTQIIIVKDHLEMELIGSTIDDAVGEAFDKVAKLLGLPQPGGPAVEAEAGEGDPARFALPRPLLDRPGCDLSFSGLKTAVRRACDRLVAEQGGLTRADRADLCAGFQAAVVETLAEKTRRSCAAFAADHGPRCLAVAGGVAANAAIRAALRTVAEEQGFGWSAPPLRLCTDNGAMIAWAAAERMALEGPDDLALSARPRWPLDREAAPLLGSGRKGAKA